ncbi:MAG: hypothetical protein ACOC3V_03290 [bacterium]
MIELNEGDCFKEENESHIYMISKIHIQKCCNVFVLKKLKGEWALFMSRIRTFEEINNKINFGIFKKLDASEHAKLLLEAGNLINKIDFVS